MEEFFQDGGISLRQLAHFVAIAEKGTIGGAADAMFMSRSAMAASLTELERTLEADLCVRKRAQGVTLTPVGRMVLDRARIVLSETAELKHLARGQDTLYGPLSLGCFVTLGPTVLPKLLDEFESRYPTVSVSFTEGSQDVLRDGLSSGRIDLALMYNMGELADFDYIPLYEPRGYALFGADHPLAASESVTLQQLAQEPLVLFSQPPSADYAMAAFSAHGLTPNVRHRTYSYELTRSIVARGKAYGILVQKPTNKASYEGLPIIEREVTPRLPSVPVVLTWLREGRLSPRARAMLELASSLYRKPPELE